MLTNNMNAAYCEHEYNLLPFVNMNVIYCKYLYNLSGWKMQTDRGEWSRIKYYNYCVDIQNCGNFAKFD